MTREEWIHDCAWACAVSILECMKDCLRGEEVRGAFEEVYRRIRAALECYDKGLARTPHHAQPSRN